jgi:DNA-directed RNA polymerase alpha subunit
MEAKLVVVEAPEQQLSNLEFNLLRRLSNTRLSGRSINCLNRAKILYVKDLVVKTESEMLRKWNLDQKSLRELRDFLSSIDLKFGMTVKDLERPITGLAISGPNTGDQSLQTNFVRQLLQPLSSTRLSFRSINCLNKAQIFFIKDLIVKTEAEILREPNLGRTSLQEIRAFVSGMDLKLGMEFEDLERLMTGFAITERTAEDPHVQSKLAYNLLKPLSSFELSVRSVNCLNNANILFVKDLVLKTEDEMLREPNLGRKSLKELRELLSDMNLSFGLTGEHLERLMTTLDSGTDELSFDDAGETADEFAIIRKFNELGLFKPVELLPLSIRAQNGLETLNIRYVGELCTRSERELRSVPLLGRTSVEEIRLALQRLELQLGMNIRGWPPANLEGLAETYREQSLLEDAEGLKNAFFRTLRKIEDQRHLFIIASRLGLGGPPKTLEETGQHLGVTRERVRQIQKKLIGVILQQEVWDDILRYRIAKLLKSRSEPLFLDSIGEEDPWFEGFESNLSLLENLIDTFVGDDKLFLFKIDDRSVISRIDYETWREIRFDLISMLAATVGHGHTMEDVELFIESKLKAAGAPDLSPALFDHLSKDLNFSSLNGDLVLVSVGNFLADRLTVLLEEAPKPLHFNEISRLYEQRFGVEVSPRNIHAALGINGFLIFGRGTYGLPKHLRVEPHVQSQVLRAVEDKLSAQTVQKQWHSKDLLPFIKGIPGTEAIDMYGISIILKPSSVLQYLGKWCWRLGSHSDEDGERIFIKQVVYSALKESPGPLHTQDILSLVTESRGVGQIFQLQPNELFSRVDPSTWGLLERDFLFTIAEQSEIKNFFFDRFSERGVALHKSELLEAIDTFHIPRGLTDNIVLGILTSDSRFKSWSGGFVGLARWTGTGRKSLAEAVNEIVLQTVVPRTYEDIVRQLRSLIGYEFSRNSLSVHLGRAGMAYDWEIGRWRRL